jgi:hypothetical protein
MIHRLRTLFNRSVVALLLLLLVPAAHAHVGSKNVFETVHAGPYTLYVTIRPPNVIPGVATVEIRSSGAAVRSVKITPLPVTGEAAKHPPAADTMQASIDDPAFFTGAVWMMATGAWQVRIQADGAAGPETASVPVLAVPVTTLKMQRGMGWTLALLGLFLVVSMAGIVAAAVRDAALAPGASPTPLLRRRGLIAMSISLVLMAGMVYLGGKWWNVEAANYSGNIFAPAATIATLSGDELDLHVSRSGKVNSNHRRDNDDYILDHNQIMHLYAIRQPQMDAVFHLHPALVAKGDFRMTLPSMPPGEYKLYGDVVHANGFPETLLATVSIPATMPRTPLAADDAQAFPAPLAQGELGTSYKLPDGYMMVWDKPATIKADTAYTFRFRLLAPDGQPATNMQPYLGMAGHAAFVKTDGTVFAHTHPEGSAPMADVMLADASLSSDATTAMASPAQIAPQVDFPYGFPTSGRYRIFIQMKHGNVVETGAFDAQVH